MHNTINNLENIKNKLVNYPKAKIIAVSKTFNQEHIVPLLDYGHKDFGENKIQEALQKWPSLKEKYTDIKLHMIGKLQTNKVKHALSIFDYLHSLDTLKLAKKISFEQKIIAKKIKCFIQVNIGNEDQKNGISPKDTSEFYNTCVNDLDINIIGLMCLPPKSVNSNLYFSQMNILNKQIGLHELSMGMSNDYIEALAHGATFLRIGSKIFGQRN